MSYPQHDSEGGAVPEHRYPSAYQPIQPSYQAPQPSYQPGQPSYPPYPPAQPGYQANPATGGRAVGSTPVFEATRQMPTGPGVGGAPPYGTPVPGLPSGPPVDPAQPGAARPAGRGRGVPLLAALAVLLLLVSGVMTALYVTRSSQLSDTKQDVASRDTKIKDLESQLDKAKDDLAAARQDLTGTQNAQKETQRQKQVIGKCLTLLADLGRAAQRNDAAEYNKIAKSVDKTCSEAEKYLD